MRTCTRVTLQYARVQMGQDIWLYIRCVFKVLLRGALYPEVHQDERHLSCRRRIYGRSQGTYHKLTTSPPPLSSSQTTYLLQRRKQEQQQRQERGGELLGANFGTDAKVREACHPSVSRNRSRKWSHQEACCPRKPCAWTYLVGLCQTKFP